jgi:hypothetical protein
MYVSQHLTKGPGTDDGGPLEAHDGPMPSRTRQSRCQQIIDLIDDTLAEYDRTRPAQPHPVKEALR